jgi:hypothetical protein
MKSIRSLIIATFALALPVNVTLAQAISADSAKRIAIRRLLAVQHTDSLVLAGIEQGFAPEAEQSNTPGLPAGFLDSVRVRARQNIGVFVERLVPVYDSLYTAGEIDQLIAFYLTPLGQRVVATQAALAAATAEAGRQWGMELAAQVLLDFSRRPKRP